VCNPPFAGRSWGLEELSADPRWEHGVPPRLESELAWIQHALVVPGGPVVMLMPPAAAAGLSGRPQSRTVEVVAPSLLEVHDLNPPPPARDDDA
jgi:hypothetical protein